MSRRPDPRTWASERLRVAVKLHRLRTQVPEYRLAQLIGVHRSTLACWLCHVTPIRVGDPRVVQLATLVDIHPDACFERRRLYESRRR